MVNTPYIDTTIHWRDLVTEERRELSIYSILFDLDPLARYKFGGSGGIDRNLFDPLHT